MKIAAISDIHGNLAALDAVLADAARRGVDRIVNLGDSLSGPLYPRETADRLMPLGLPTIAGNHERQLLALPPERMSPADRHALSALRPDQLDWIGRLPRTLRLSRDLLLVHGTPASDLAYFLETVTPDGVRPATRAEIAERARGTRSRVILCGHSHVPRVVRLDGRLIVNPGSVGLPAYEDDRPFPHAVGTGTPHARYAIVEEGDEGWSAELVAVDYPWDAAARQADRNGRPDWARALLTGRARRR